MLLPAIPPIGAVIAHPAPRSTERLVPAAFALGAAKIPLPLLDIPAHVELGHGIMGHGIRRTVVYQTPVKVCSASSSAEGAISAVAVGDRLPLDATFADAFADESVGTRT